MNVRMCAISVIALCITPPGYFFPQMCGDYTGPVKELKEKDSILLEPKQRRKYQELV
jgi:hypothetical protein